MRVNPLRALPLLLVAGALPLAAQTTGAVQGRVKTSQGAPVGGARITLSGANLQGTRTAATEADGTFRFGLIPPGPYTLTLVKEGMNTTKVSTQVGLDKTATVDVTMATVAAAVVEVTDVATSIDVKATTVGSNFTNDTFTKLPLTRDFASIATLAPGVTTDAAPLPGGQTGFRVYGGSPVDNNYVVDGINTTGVEFGAQGKKIPVEFIQEFQLKTGGFEAEYGRTTGGIVNVITKSGGNDFSGDAFYYYESKSLQLSNRHGSDNAVGAFAPLTQGHRKADFGFDFGGPIIKDRLWFFVAYDRTDFSRQDRIVLGSTAGSIADQDRHTDLFSGKLTWRLSENQNLIGSFVGDPSKTTGEVDGKPTVGPKSTWDGVQKVGGTDLSLRYEISGASWFVQLQASRHREVNDTLPGAGGNGIQFVQSSDSSASGGFGRWDSKDFTRDSYAGSFTKFIDLWGSHELKFGFDIQADKADISRNYTGGQQVTVYGPDPNQGNQVKYSHTWWTTADATSGVTQTGTYVDGNGDTQPIYTFTPAQYYAPSITFTSHPKHESQAYYIQDKWSVNANWTLNLGVRTDRTAIKDQFGNTVINFTGEYAPRLGVVWDWNGKGQDKVYLTAGRFFEQVPLDLVIRSFSVERNPVTFNFSATDPTPNVPPNTDITIPAAQDQGYIPSIAGSYVEPVDPDLKAQYMDQFILGAETTWGGYVLGAKYIRNYLGRVVEDALDVNSPNLDYFIMNPGFSQTGKQYPRATRDYHGVELSAQRRFADRYTWQLSYLWSELNGNYEGGFSGIGGPNGAGQLDPNITAAFDEPAFLVNNHGALSSDRKHQLKANGYYEHPAGWSIGASFTFATGTPLTRMGVSDYVQPFPYQGRYELFLTPRGAEGRAPSTARLDLNFAWAFRLQGKQQLRLMADVTNLLNNQGTTSVDQRYNFADAQAPSGFDPNPHYLQPATYQEPLGVRIGLRYSF